MKKIFSILFFTIITFTSYSQSELPKVLLRVDDIGMNHAVNSAIKELAESGIPSSTSVMFACPWYQEAVEILKNYPKVSVGVHLTLNAEWKYYRWGPILGKTAVPSLVDSLGYFYSSTDQFLKSGYKLDEVEKELSAQIERALNSGVKIDYVDYHMGTAISTPELRSIVEKLAEKYKVGISMYFGEDYKTMWPVEVSKKKSELMAHLKTLKRDQINLIEWHVAVDSPEMQVLVDMNSDVMNSKDGKPMAAQHRRAELTTLLSKDFRDQIGKNFKLVTYKELLKNPGLKGMKRPE